jgi:hypothetical protein
MKFRIMAGAAAGALALGFAAGIPAAAEPNNADQTGLVNLALQDTDVQVPIGLAANICGVPVNVIATDTLTGPVNCDAEGVSTAERSDNGGTNNARQRGLVNVAVQDTTVQVPVAVAANVCGIPVNLIAAETITGETTCEALAEATSGA